MTHIVDITLPGPRLGPCVGGPWNGKVYHHFNGEDVPVYGPSLINFWPNIARATIEPRKLGDYIWLGTQWRWRPER